MTDISIIERASDILAFFKLDEPAYRKLDKQAYSMLQFLPKFIVSRRSSSVSPFNSTKIGVRCFDNETVFLSEDFIIFKGSLKQFYAFTQERFNKGLAMPGKDTPLIQYSREVIQEKEVLFINRFKEQFTLKYGEIFIKYFRKRNNTSFQRGFKGIF